MKVGSTSSTSSSAGSGGARPAAEGFSQLLSGGATPVRGASAAGGVANVSAVSALLALQGLGGPEARARALRKGRRILDALDRLQVALLGDGPTRGHLNLLKGALAEEREMSGDPGLDETLHWAEVRAAVEAAKLERQPDAA